MEYVKLLRENTYDVQNIDDKNSAQELLDNGYLPTQEVNSLPNNELYTYCFYSLALNEGKRVYEKTLHTNMKEVVGEKITSLKQQLANTDYKVVKNMESQMAMEDLPYEPNALHNERQVLRDKINELENLLKTN